MQQPPGVDIFLWKMYLKIDRYSSNIYPREWLFVLVSYEGLCLGQLHRIRHCLALIRGSPWFCPIPTQNWSLTIAACYSLHLVQLQLRWSCYVWKLNTLQVATHISYEGGTLLGADASDLSLSRFDPRPHLNMDIETCQSCQCLAMQRCNLAKCST